MVKAAIEINTLFLIAVTALFLLFGILILLGFIKIGDTTATPMICNSKLLTYCNDWSRTEYQNTPYNWGDKASGCIKIGITPSLDKCKELLNQK
jgi:hypothetical protein